MDQTNSKHTVQGNQLIIDGSVIPFKFSIAQVIEVENMLVVRLEVPVKVTYNENVFGVIIAEKKIKWQIEKWKYNAKMESCPFVGINLVDDQLILSNWCDTYLVVEPQTGKVLKDGYTK